MHHTAIVFLGDDKCVEKCQLLALKKNGVHWNLEEVAILLDDELPRAWFDNFKELLNGVWVKCNRCILVFGATALNMVKNLRRHLHIILEKPNLIQTKGLDDVHGVEEHRVLVVVVLLIELFILWNLPFIMDTFLGEALGDELRKLLIYAHNADVFLDIIFRNACNCFLVETLVTNKTQLKHCISYGKYKYLSYFARKKVYCNTIMAIDKVNVKLSSGEKAAAKKLKAKENRAKANPELAAENKAKSDAKRERRAAAGSSKTFK